MFRYVLSSGLSSLIAYKTALASHYFYLPIDDDPPPADACQDPSSSSKPPSIAWDSCETADAILSARAHDPPSRVTAKHRQRRADIDAVLAENDLYKILGIAFAPELDKLELRRAYLSRSKACHPDKFPGNPEATLAFQKVSLAYNILSNPAHKRVYDAHPGGREFAHADAGAEETLRSVVLGVFNDFLDGDLEMVCTLLRAMNDLIPAMRLGDDGIASILSALHSVRERVLTCRVLTQTFLATIAHLLETQASLAKLSYLALRPRARLSLRLVRITLALPLALDGSLRAHRATRAHSRARRRRREERGWCAEEDACDEEDGRGERVFPRRVLLLIEGLVAVLERMEDVLK